jgi:hypothetical protein
MASPPPRRTSIVHRDVIPPDIGDRRIDMADADIEGVSRSRNREDVAESPARSHLPAKADEIAISSHKARHRLRW